MVVIEDDPQTPNPAAVRVPSASRSGASLGSFDSLSAPSNLPATSSYPEASSDYHRHSSHSKNSVHNVAHSIYTLKPSICAAGLTSSTFAESPQDCWVVLLPRSRRQFSK